MTISNIIEMTQNFKKRKLKFDRTISVETSRNNTGRLGQKYLKSRIELFTYIFKEFHKIYKYKIFIKSSNE